MMGLLDNFFKNLSAKDLYSRSLAIFADGEIPSSSLLSDPFPDPSDPGANTELAANFEIYFKGAAAHYKEAKPEFDADSNQQTAKDITDLLKKWSIPAQRAEMEPSDFCEAIMDKLEQLNQSMPDFDSMLADTRDDESADPKKAAAKRLMLRTFANYAKTLGVAVAVVAETTQHTSADTAPDDYKLMYKDIAMRLLLRESAENLHDPPKELQIGAEEDPVEYLKWSSQGLEQTKAVYVPDEATRGRKAGPSTGAESVDLLQKFVESNTKMKRGKVDEINTQNRQDRATAAGNLADSLRFGNNFLSAVAVTQSEGFKGEQTDNEKTALKRAWPIAAAWSLCLVEGTRKALGSSRDDAGSVKHTDQAGKPLRLTSEQLAARQVGAADLFKEVGKDEEKKEQGGRRQEKEIL